MKKKSTKLIIEFLVTSVKIYKSHPFKDWIFFQYFQIHGKQMSSNQAKGKNGRERSKLEAFQKRSVYEFLLHDSLDYN